MLACVRRYFSVALRKRLNLSELNIPTDVHGGRAAGAAVRRYTALVFSPP